MDIRNFIKSIAGLSQNTQRAYEQTLWQLNSYIKGKEPTDQEILKFLQSYSASSLHRHKAAIKAYREYKNPGEPWPFSHRLFTPIRNEIIRYVPPESVAEMADAADNEDDRMYVLTQFTLGCRINELMGIQEKDITPAGVMVLAKGGTYRLKVITKDFYPVIAEYAKGKKGRIFPRPYTYYYKTLKELGGRVGHPEVSTHMLRHSRAVDLLRKGMSLAFVQQFLGHANINTTARYLLITGGELSDELAKAEKNGVANL